MTLSYLTDDCFYYILQYLQNDNPTLYNCLLVNRFWCKTTIPILYANPFAVKISTKSHLIISTIIFCFNKAEILQLKEQLEVNQINNINIDEEHKPLFEYPKYLENYNDFEIDSAILRYCSGLSISYNKMCSDIIPIFHQSILRQSRNIKKLDISLDLFYEKSFKNFNVQNSNLNLIKLNSLSICLNGTTNNEVGQEFLRNIADVSLNLRQLIINFNQGSRRLLINPTTSNNLIDTTTWKKLYKIIQRQNKLKIFIIWNCFLLNNILSSLEFQKHSLVHIEFHNANFVNVNLKSLNNLNNLECLIFESCGGLLLNQCEILNFASFKLKELSLKHNKWDGDATLSIIKYLGEPLQKISVENITIPLIENISLYCPNLILLKIGIFPNNELYELEFYRKLANNVPINVSKISCFILKKFLNFKEFLENCHNNFEMINLNYNIELEFLKIVLDYIERSNNNLKTLGGIILDENFNEEELKLLNQIKDKGIKLVEFNSIHYI
ncbi:uncharacterized protein OCT59_012953 [Rhizophagus irregularis]|uniref:F-box domain-containing protein n=1 Tax=Rhizophagus irregularis (strain DAOM 181602 / DAOM 197198 / MUCL 43194) TaxID=747089 RepID=A0A2H5SNF4_RHIID|nr:hypothetical protein GLOIN_2v1844065 [Rhizophagus irregularis DAOM 181602=DAOM 197198]POG66605.1 hypothetical protein GLOIN_2v1844065 [Rhizophagus irregularis DAOM 181602=DAOM 197198]UZO20530.1 hypothetical protein OCT59_012953 [Rhizophagus irregularis]|eukprot:XP_025173471.1 hypothetical protein GLOIN_2v1844065 [Rhizophagus irregularis DAOM 181602=DAOM 197198]